MQMAARSAWVLGSFGAITALLGGCYDPPGPELGSVAVEVDKPFSLELSADGKPTRLWLDYECFGAPFIVSVLVNAGGAEQKLEIDTVHTHYVVNSREGRGRELKQGMLLFELPPYPSGSRVKISGTLRQKPGKVVSFGGDGKKTPPDCTSLRFWAAR